MYKLAIVICYTCHVLAIYNTMATKSPEMFKKDMEGDMLV